MPWTPLSPPPGHSLHGRTRLPRPGGRRWHIPATTRLAALPLAASSCASAARCGQLSWPLLSLAAHGLSTPFPPCPSVTSTGQPLRSVSLDLGVADVSRDSMEILRFGPERPGTAPHVGRAMSLRLITASVGRGHLRRALGFLLYTCCLPLCHEQTSNFCLLGSASGGRKGQRQLRRRRLLRGRVSSRFAPPLVNRFRPQRGCPSSPTRWLRG